ncbi:MAG: hypothetical protein ACOC8C_02710, partial [Chloroflexota bacterium]
MVSAQDIALNPPIGPISLGQALLEAAAGLSTVSETPRAEAERLLTHVLDITRSTLLAHPEHRLTEGALNVYRELVDQRLRNYPLPYLIGEIEFYGLD